MEAKPYYFGDAESRSSAQVVEYLAEHEAWRSCAANPLIDPGQSTESYTKALHDCVQSV
jgi:hypothetical protein